MSYWWLSICWSYLVNSGLSQEKDWLAVGGGVVGCLWNLSWDHWRRARWGEPGVYTAKADEQQQTQERQPESQSHTNNQVHSSKHHLTVRERKSPPHARVVTPPPQVYRCFISEITSASSPSVVNTGLLKNSQISYSDYFVFKGISACGKYVPQENSFTSYPHKTSMWSTRRHIPTFGFWFLEWYIEHFLLPGYNNS
jgi:hypothetical protein